jgi:hypothetical protein
VLLTSAGRPVYLDDPLTAGSPVARWKAKADAFATGWLSLTEVPLLVPGVALALAQAQHETWCGDAWPGEHNWGAVQKRRPTTAEAGILAGLPPLPANVAQARALLAAAIAQKTIPAFQNEALHVDSSPVLPPPHWYWMFFWAFTDDNGGALLFAKELTARSTCKQILQDATGVWTNDCEDFSAALYASHYYEGVNNPATPEGRQKNIDDYAKSMLNLVSGIASALSDWTPPGVTVVPSPSVTSDPHEDPTDPHV